MNDNDVLSRRRFLRTIGRLGVSGGLVVLTACSSDSSESAGTETTDRDQVAAGGDPCSDLSELSASEKKTREAVGYVKEAPDPTTRCDNCQFWLPPDEGDPCGGCVVVPGPIHAGGYCNSWAPVKET